MEIKYKILPDFLYTKLLELKNNGLDEQSKEYLEILQYQHILNRHYTIKVKKNIKVFALKTIIQENHSLLHSVLYYDDQLMNNDKKIKDYKLEKEIIVVVSSYLETQPNSICAMIGPPTKYWKIT